MAEYEDESEPARGRLYIAGGPVARPPVDRERDARIQAYRARERAKVVAAFDRFLERMWNDPYGERPEWADPPVWLRTDLERAEGRLSEHTDRHRPDSPVQGCTFCVQIQDKGHHNQPYGVTPDWMTGHDFVPRESDDLCGETVDWNERRVPCGGPRDLHRRTMTTRGDMRASGECEVLPSGGRSPGVRRGERGARPGAGPVGD